VIAIRKATSTRTSRCARGAWGCCSAPFMIARRPTARPCSANRAIGTVPRSGRGSLPARRP
jgi:hypothetical protein